MPGDNNDNNMVLLSASEEAEQVKNVHSLTLNEGETWSIIDDKWLQSWINYTGFDLNTGKTIEPKSSHRPPPIDNSRLVDPDVKEYSVLKKPIVEHSDYGIVNKQVANLLYQWYSDPQQAPVRFDRQVITLGLHKTAQLQFYPQALKLIPINKETGEPDFDSAQIKLFSGKLTWEEIRKQMIADESKVASAVDAEDKESPLRFWIENPEAKQPQNNNGNNNNDSVTSTNGDMSTAAVLVSPNGTSTTATTSGPTVEVLPLDADETPKPSNDSENNASTTNTNTNTNAMTDSSPEDSVNTNNSSSNPGAVAPSPPPKVRKIEPYIKISEDQYNQPIESFQYPPCAPILFEFRKADGSWARNIIEKNWKDFEIGDIIDARDTVQKWYESTVRDVKDDKIFIHFNGWAATWDEWLSKDSDRIAKKGTYTTGPRAASSGGGMGSYSSGMMMGWGGYSSSSEGIPNPSGAVGLYNLGNTCFMNSVLQSMAHCPILTDYFLTEQYVPHINRDNPLGWQGKIADEYAGLIKDYWSNKYTVVAPRAFKLALGEFAPRFSGFQQQDSSELLSFLLDGLHEDLNLIKKKPATNAVESNNRPDEIVANEAWEVYQLRNKSVIVNTLQGQLKSKLVCPTNDCGKISITFDPFMFLSVPLPIVEDCVQTIHFVFADPTKPITVYSAIVSKVSRIPDLKEAVSKLNGVSAKRMVVADMWHHKLFKILDDETSVSEIRASDITYIYELPELDAYKSVNEYIPVQVVNQTLVRNNNFNPNFNMTNKEFILENFGLPRIIGLPKKTETNGLHIKQLLQSLIPLMKKQNIADNEIDYEIRILDNDGRHCYTHGVMSNCIGCVLPENNEPFNLNIDRSDNTAGVVFGIVWKKTGEELQYNNDFDTNIQRDASANNNNNNGNLNRVHEAVELTDCIKAFTKPETLGEEDMWYCNKCKDFKQASKQMSIWSLPRILIIHLKRFQYTRSNRDKINTLVNFPLEGLDLTPYVVSDESKKDAVYDCFAVSNHMGGMGGGHYNAYIKNLLTQQWFLHDDSHVSQVNNMSQIISSSAYVLFYRLRSLQLSPPKPLTSNNTNNNDNSNNNNNNNTSNSNNINDSSSSTSGIESAVNEMSI